MCFKKVKVDFDKYFKFKDVEGMKPNDVQEYIDNDYMVLYRKCYQHHEGFLMDSLCDKCKPNDLIIVGGKRFLVIKKDIGIVKDNNIYVGNEMIYDNTPKILHCLDNNGGRFVMYIKAI